MKCYQERIDNWSLGTTLRRNSSSSASTKYPARMRLLVVGQLRPWLRRPSVRIMMTSLSVLDVVGF